MCVVREFWLEGEQRALDEPGGAIGVSARATPANEFEQALDRSERMRVLMRVLGLSGDRFEACG
jgi:hypothetical protein